MEGETGKRNNYGLQKQEQSPYVVTRISRVDSLMSREQEEQKAFHILSFFFFNLFCFEYITLQLGGNCTVILCTICFLPPLLSTSVRHIGE